MAFLDPAQAAPVYPRSNGPAPIRGAVGTGKTVVDLRRAAYLTRLTGGRVLFTTYMGTLQRVLKSLLAPDTVGRVDFVDVHAFARHLLNEREIAFRVAEREARLAFDDDWTAIRASNSLRSPRLIHCSPRDCCPPWEDREQENY